MGAFNFSRRVVSYLTIFSVAIEIFICTGIVMFSFVICNRFFVLCCSLLFVCVCVCVCLLTLSIL